MRPLSEIYRELVAAGATPEVIALAIEAYESGGQSAFSGGKSGGQPQESGGQPSAETDAYERRKAWDRAYRARRRAEKSGGQSGQSGGQKSDPPPPPSSPLVPPLSPAPLTPPIIPPLSAPPTEPRGVAALRDEAVKRRMQVKRWSEFRQTYPKREGSQSWPMAEKKYAALVASGVAEADIILGARRYAEHLEATGSAGTRFVKHASAWLNQKGWEDEYLTGTGRRQQSDLMDAFDARRREAEAFAGDRTHRQGDGPAWDIDATALPD